MLLDKTQVIIMVKKVLVQFYQQLHLQVVEVEVLNPMDQVVQVVVHTEVVVHLEQEIHLQ